MPFTTLSRAICQLLQSAFPTHAEEAQTRASFHRRGGMHRLGLVTGIAPSQGTLRAPTALFPPSWAWPAQTHPYCSGQEPLGADCSLLFYLLFLYMYFGVLSLRSAWVAFASFMGFQNSWPMFILFIGRNAYSFLLNLNGSSLICVSVFSNPKGRGRDILSPN